jgi:hypothetical protein
VNSVIASDAGNARHHTGQRRFGYSIQNWMSSIDNPIGRAGCPTTGGLPPLAEYIGEPAAGSVTRGGQTSARTRD